MDTMRNLSGLLICIGLVSVSAWAEDAKEADDLKVYVQQVVERASKGDTKAQVCEGDMYAVYRGSTPDYANALKWYQTAAKAGEPLATLRIAQQYQYGYGVERDPKKAMTMFRDLFTHGYLPAATSVGELYFTGAGVPVDYPQALEWFTKAAASGDYWAEAHLAVVYQLGFGVEKDSAKARQWSIKAAEHKIDCLPTFGQLVPLIVNGYLQGSKDMETSTSGQLTISFTYNDGMADDVTLMQSSGSPGIDSAWLDATHRAKLPPWPEAFHADKKTLSFIIPGAYSDIHPAFSKAILDAIHAAVVMPKEVILNGSTGTGFAIVSFDYLDGTVSNAKIETSSKDQHEDAEAIRATEKASYSAVPATYPHKKLHLSLKINFENIGPAASSVEVSPSGLANASAADAEFNKNVQAAVQAVTVLPKDVLLHGTTGTGVAVVAFDYVDGAVSNVKIETTSNDPYEDAEAIRAAEHADYPLPPAARTHQKLHLSVAVSFESINPVAKPATVSAPASATGSH
jgi:outer membrane biosynthesis protein TonB